MPIRQPKAAGALEDAAIRNGCHAEREESQAGNLHMVIKKTSPEHFDMLLDCRNSDAHRPECAGSGEDARFADRRLSLQGP